MTVYALYAGNCPENIRYVGATTISLPRRLQKHVGATKKSKRLLNWFAEVAAAGSVVCIRALCHHRTLAALCAAESRWINKLRSQGHGILNRRPKAETAKTWATRFNYDFNTKYQKRQRDWHAMKQAKA